MNPFICQIYTNIHNCWTSFSPPSGSKWKLKTKSDHFSTLIAFRVYLMFSKISIMIKHHNKFTSLSKTYIFENTDDCFQKNYAANLKRCKWVLGVPMHVKMTFTLNMWFIIISIDYNALLVLNKILYVNYIALAIDPFFGGIASRAGPHLQIPAGAHTTPAP